MTGIHFIGQPHRNYRAAWKGYQILVIPAPVAAIAARIALPVGISISVRISLGSILGSQPAAIGSPIF
jgi:hypothetical protein